MANIGVKRLLIYKHHIFPETKKPFRTAVDYFQYKNPDLDRVKIKKMYQLLDEDEKKRLRQQKDLINDDINAALHKYNLTYIRPLEKCPDFYQMLFSYAQKKMEVLLQNKAQLDNAEPFFLEKNQIKVIAKSVIVKFNEDKITSTSPKNEQNNQPAQDPPIPPQQTDTIDKTQLQKRQKLLFHVYSGLYPSQKTYMYSTFFRAYKNFLMKQKTISQQLLQNNIFFLKPFLFKSPVELYQSSNPDKTMKQCEKILVDDVFEREKMCIKLKELVEQREKDLRFIEGKFRANINEIRCNSLDSYTNTQKYKSFYTMLKMR